MLDVTFVAYVHKACRTISQSVLSLADKNKPVCTRFVPYHFSPSLLFCSVVLDNTPAQRTLITAFRRSTVCFHDSYARRDNIDTTVIHRVTHGPPITLVDSYSSNTGVLLPAGYGPACNERTLAMLGHDSVEARCTAKAPKS